MDNLISKSLIAEIKEYIADEDEDVEKYTKLSEKVPPEYASIIGQIAKEERIHQKNLVAILSDIAQKEDPAVEKEPE